jgi:hypothetical protein
VENPVYRGGGSIGIIGAARSALLVGKHPEDETRRVLCRTKGNLAAEPASLAYSIEPYQDCATVTWHGEVEVTAADLVSRPKGDTDDARARKIKGDGADVLTILDKYDATRAGLKLRDIKPRVSWGRDRLNRACVNLVDDGVCVWVDIEAVSGKGKPEKASGIRRR